ncbi:MAG: hypothetical protein V1820_03750 [archaeon]
MPGPPPPFFFFAWDTFYTCAVLLFCFLIYFRTRELYELTRHSGIGHFRNAFLFFGLSYLSIFLFTAFEFSFVSERFFFRSHLLPLLFILPMGYFGTIAVFYLVIGSLRKKSEKGRTRGATVILILAHVCAVALSVIAFLVHTPFFLAYIQAALLISALVLLPRPAIAKAGKVGKMRVVYELVLVFWIVNILLTSPSLRIHFLIRPVVQALSLLLFIYIYSRLPGMNKG